MKAKSFFSAVLIVFITGLLGILLKLWNFVYNLEITTICCNLNFAKIYARFGVNLFSPEFVVV